MLGVSEYSDEIQLMAVDPPNAPVLTLDQEARTIDSVTMDFTPDPFTGGSLIIGYKLWRDEGLGGSPFSLIYDGSGRAQQIYLTDSDVKTSFEYTYRLYSINAIYESSAYGELVLKIGLPPGKPGKPVSLGADFAAQTITLTWLKPESNGGWPILTFELWIDDGAGTWPADPVSLDAAVLDLEDLQYLMQGLTGGYTYAVKITATNAIGTSEESDTQYLVCADIPDPPDAAPTLEAATDSTITIAWNPPAHDGGSAIIGYRVYMNYLRDGDWEMVYDGYQQPSVVYFTMEDLQGGDLYRFRVSSINIVGEGDPSDEDTFLCASLPSAPSQPQFVTSTQESITIKWRPPEDTGGAVILAYEVFYKLQTEPESSWALVETVNINTLSFTHTVSNASSDVQYKVRAQTDAGYGPFSIRNTFGLASVPSITQAPVKLASTSSSITVAWVLDSDGGTPITGYRLYQTNVTTGGVYLVYDGANIPTVSSV